MKNLLMDFHLSSRSLTEEIRLFKSKIYGEVCICEIARMHIFIGALNTQFVHFQKIFQVRLRS